MCVNPLTIVNPRKDFDSRFDRLYLNVPCGHCWQCLQQRQYDYQIRAVSEFQHLLDSGGSLWNYTLTYNDTYVPKYMGVKVLCRRDIQLFKKKLKKYFSKHFPGVIINCLYAGEYGHEKDRPHWHILLYCSSSMDSQKMAFAVRFAWSYNKRHYSKAYKRWYVESHPLGYVGFPSKWLDGVLLPFLPENANLDNILAVKYTIKYIFKSYNFYQSLFEQFTKSLIENYGLTEDEVSNFIFPQDSRFNFPDQELDIKVISNFFSRCYRSFNNFGLSQLSQLDDNYISQTDFFVKKDGHDEPVFYSISNYLKNRIFHLGCKEGDDLICSRYTPKWLDFQKKSFKNFAVYKSNYYFCNRNIKLHPESTNDNPCFVYVADVIDYITDNLASDLTSFFLYYNTYYHRPFLTQYTIPDALGFIQSRRLDSYDILDNEISAIDELIDYIKPYLDICDQSISYENYLVRIDHYNERQDLIALEYAKVNKKYNPKKLYKLPFSKFINLKLISSDDAKKNF